MKNASWLCVWALLIGTLASCASPEKTGAALRKEGYDEIARSIKPGMYRRQLYALLPPMRKPEAHPPRADPIYSLPPGPRFSEHQEMHELDEECHLVVRYQLKNGSEYTDPSAGKRAARNTAKSGAINPDSIDALLRDITATMNPYKAGPTPSRENPDDIITHVSRTVIKRPPGPDAVFGTGGWPTQEHYRFGRVMPALNRARDGTADFPAAVGKSRSRTTHRVSDSPFEQIPTAKR